ncbi:Ppx/GppA phosphatase family protein [Leptolyngbya sp. BC1307]|uniref:Ppx/GppA phosphatase family protein n=1 Tax=Leptolyngbya sp. BC1307 TaxID=2029589 RepID=UPI000EFD63DC|nr:Ppx/GppA phosphatase family protein [Leptolyngbya sp. BC1307]
MKLAAIDIGTNSIHMIVVDVLQRRNFEIVDREKEMVKLGAGVFATNRLSDRAFDTGLETIQRYVQLADQLGVDEIITAATSAIREAQNGEAFLNQVVRRTQIAPRMISGKEEARLIFLAVRNAIAIADENALVLDIGGGSTEVVVGNQDQIRLGTSLKLGVLRLLDMVADQGPMGDEARGVLESHIRFLAQQTLAEAREIGFTQVIGTSGTIRTLGEAAYRAKQEKSLRSVNAEVVQLSALQDLTEQLISLKPSKRADIDGISEKRTDAIHLGGILLLQLLEMAETNAITLCDASLREGLILDYLERHSQNVVTLIPHQDLRHRKAAQLVYKYGSDWEGNTHIAALACQLFDQTQTRHSLGDLERSVLEYAALLHDIGQYISFRGHHKNSRYILKRADPRGFTDEEMLLIGHVIRYHRKAHPTKKHKKYKRLSDSQQQIVRVLAGLLRIAVGLDRTKNQLVKSVSCQIEDQMMEINVGGDGDLALEMWAAEGDRDLLAEALDCTVHIQSSSLESLKVS